MLAHTKKSASTPTKLPQPEESTGCKLTRPGPVGPGRQYECEVIAYRIKEGKEEFYVRWVGWGDEGAEWRKVRSLCRDPPMKLKYNTFRKALAENEQVAVQALLLLSKS